MTKKTYIKHRAAFGASALVAALLLAGCSSPAGTAEPETQPSAESTAQSGFADMDARELIDRLDAMPVADRPTDLIASVRPDELLLTDAEGTETALPMPDDQFYLSIAPYVDQTHDCYFHSLTTCLGELQNEDLHVTVVDDATGQVVLDEPMRTFDNGFVGLWLPRGLDATLTVEHDGKSASTQISTGSAEDMTCLTSLQLA